MWELFIVCKAKISNQKLGREELGTRLGLKWRRNGGLRVKVLTKLVSVEENRKTAHFTTIFGSNIRVICARLESWEEEGRRE